jgi:hypothetical protein
MFEIQMFFMTHVKMLEYYFLYLSSSLLTIQAITKVSSKYTLTVKYMCYFKTVYPDINQYG